MQARVKMQNDIMVVSLTGRVDVETAEPFRAACRRELAGRRIVFDYAGLNFVGSQGILPFLETLQAFYETSPGSFKFCGVGIEFRKLFAATPLSVVEIYDSIDQAVMAFYIPVTQPVTMAAAQPVPLAPTEFIAYRSEPTPGEVRAAANVDEDIDA